MADVKYCKRGHPRTPENVDRFRSCILCSRLKDARRGKTEERLRGKRAASLKWRLEHPDRHRENHRAGTNARRAKRNGNGGSFTADEWNVLKRQYDNRCVSCLKTEDELQSLDRKLVPDHIVSVSKGGLGDITNIQPLCHGTGGCNNRKGSRYHDYVIS